MNIIHVNMKIPVTLEWRAKFAQNGSLKQIWQNLLNGILVQ